MMRMLFALVLGGALVVPQPNRAPMPHATGATVRRAPQPSPKASAPSSPVKDSGASFDLGVWTVHAQSIDANFKTGTFSTNQKVVMTRKGGDITADRADGNYKKKLVNLYGHVVMHDSSGDYGGLAKSRSTQPVEPSTLTADKAQIDGAAALYKASGNVHYVQGDTDVTSGQGTLNDVTHELYLKGDVHIKQGTHRIEAETTRYNTITGLAHAQGNVTIQFPGEFTRGIATPRPIRLPKNPITAPVTASPKP